MGEVWNSWEVDPPPVCTVKTVVNATEMANLKQLLFEMWKTLRSMKTLDQEAAFLSRYLFKYKRIFRHDKGMQYLVQVHQCLKRYLKLNLLQVLTSYRYCLLHNYTSTHAHLPTKQMLKWVLLRLQAFSKIFVRLIELTKASGFFYYGKLLLGWSLTSTFFIFSLIARILTCSKFMVMKAIEWYNALHRYLPFFKETAEFMPGYKLPSELKKWLGDVDLAPLKKKTTIDEIFELIDLVKEDDDGDEDDDVQVIKKTFLKNLFNIEVIEIDSDIEEVEVDDNGNEKPPPPPSTPSALNLEDVGIPVDDDDDDEIQEIEPPTKKFKKEFKKRSRKMRRQQQNRGGGFYC